MSDYFQGGLPQANPPATPYSPAPHNAVPDSPHPYSTHPYSAAPGGAQAAFPAPPVGGWPQQPGAVPWGQPQWGPPAKTSTGVKVLIGAAVALVGLVVMGILAAIAIPVFLNQRAKAEAAKITASIPESVGGLPRRHDAEAVVLEGRLTPPGSPGHAAAGVYGSSSTVAASIAIWTHPMTARDRNGFLAAAERGAADSDGLGAFFDVDPGKLGGQMRCASMSDVVTLCLFADSGAYGSLMVAKPVATGVASARALRESAEHKA